MSYISTETPQPDARTHLLVELHALKLVHDNPDFFLKQSVQWLTDQMLNRPDFIAKFCKPIPNTPKLEQWLL